jgi:magnesium chelatase family protein
LLAGGVERWGWSARATQRILRVSRTLADLADAPNILPEHIGAAMRFRPDAAARSAGP